MAGPCLADTDTVALGLDGSGNLAATTRIHTDRSGIISTTRGIAARPVTDGAGWFPNGPSDEQISTFTFAPASGMVALFSPVTINLQAPAETAPRVVTVHYQAGIQLGFASGGNPLSQAMAILTRNLDSTGYITLTDASIGGAEQKSARWSLYAMEHLTLLDTAVHTLTMQLFGMAGSFGSGSNVIAQWSARRQIRVEYT